MFLNLVVHFWCWVIKGIYFALCGIFLFLFWDLGSLYLLFQSIWSRLKKVVTYILVLLGSQFLCLWRPVTQVQNRILGVHPAPLPAAAPADRYDTCTLYYSHNYKFSWRMAFLFYFTKFWNVVRLKWNCDLAKQHKFKLLPCYR